MLDKAAIGALIRAIYDGKINPYNLPKKLYFAIAEHLKEGIFLGFGKRVESVEFNSPDYVMLQELKENVYVFSAAKTFNYVLETEGLIVENDEVLPFKEFKKRALEVYEQYNVTWLEAEYDTAIGQAQSARAWKDIEKSPFDLVKYVTVHDANVSDICRQYDGITKKRDDPFWSVASPLNHYRCRCLLQSVYDGVVSKKEIGDFEFQPTPPFKNNAGKTGQAFTKDHPYFDVPTKYRKLAKENFNLPIERATEKDVQP